MGWTLTRCWRLLVGSCESLAVDSTPSGGSMGDGQVLESRIDEFAFGITLHLAILPRFPSRGADLKTGRRATAWLCSNRVGTMPPSSTEEAPGRDDLPLGASHSTNAVTRSLHTRSGAHSGHRSAFPVAGANTKA